MEAQHLDAHGIEKAHGQTWQTHENGGVSGICRLPAAQNTPRDTSKGDGNRQGTPHECVEKTYHNTSFCDIHH